MQQLLIIGRLLGRSIIIVRKITPVVFIIVVVSVVAAIVPILATRIEARLLLPVVFRALGTAAVAVFLFSVVAALTVFLIETGKAVLSHHIFKLFPYRFGAFHRQLFGFDAPLVEGDDLERPRSIDGYQIGCHLFRRRIGELPFENIGLEMVESTLLCLQRNLPRRQALETLDVGIDLEIEAAFQFGALPRQLLRIERNILITGGTGGNRHEITNP